jgi:hypothetical protein
MLGINSMYSIFFYVDVNDANNGEMFVMSTKNMFPKLNIFFYFSYFWWFGRLFVISYALILGKMPKVGV